MATRGIPPVAAQPTTSRSSAPLASSSAAPRTTASTGSSSSTTTDLSKLPTKRLTGHRGVVRALAWNADGRRLASGATDKTIRIWQPEKDARSSVECKGHAGSISQVRWNPTHPERLASCSADSDDPKLYFWDMRQGGRPSSTLDIGTGSINMTWSPDGRTIVLGTKDDFASHVDVEAQRVTSRQKAEHEINEAIFSHNGTLLLTATDGYAQIAAFPSGEEIHRVNISTIMTTVMDLDPRGRYLAAGSNDATASLWETTEWTCVSTLGTHDDPLRACRFSSDGQYLATSSANEIKISNVPSLSKATSINTSGTASCLAWHPSKMLLAYASEDLEGGRPSGAIRIWNL